VWREPDATSLDAARARAEVPLRAGHADPAALEAVRERLFVTMWDDAGIVRNAAGLLRADRALRELAGELAATPAAGADRRAFNLAWHDWLNLANLVEVAQVIVRAAQERSDSRGAHFRDDHPAAGELASSAYTCVRQRGESLEVTMEPVRFTRVRPGETLVS
jgi:fumarate reductase flavoprotein subunit